MNLEIHRSRTVGNRMVLMDAIGQVNAVKTAWEKIDGGRAKRHELLGADAAFQALLETVEQHDQFQLLPGAALHGTGQLAEIDKQKALRQGKIFLQQAVALKGLWHHGQCRFTVIEPAGAQGVGRQALYPVAAGLAGKHGTGVAEQLFVKAKGLFVCAMQKQRQVIQRQLVKGQLCARAQGNAQPGLGFGFAGGQASEHGCRIAEVLRLGHLQRPQRHVMRASILTGCLRVATQCGTHHAVAGQGKAAAQRTLVRVRLQLHDGHRGCGRQVVRIGDFQQVMGEGRVFGVQFELYASGQVSEPFQQALDIRICAIEARQGQTPGDFRVFPGELGGAFADVLQFLVVQPQQAGIHERLRCSAGIT
ncbi:Marine sediment meta DNA [Pseudomonas syringae pv. coriandricola]|nr:Marine sediment meta DNA [Pseudomonas syringae pv. coriandricola]